MKLIRFALNCALFYCLFCIFGLIADDVCDEVQTDVSIVRDFSSRSANYYNDIGEIYTNEQKDSLTLNIRKLAKVIHEMSPLLKLTRKTSRILTTTDAKYRNCFVDVLRAAVNVSDKHPHEMEAASSSLLTMDDSGRWFLPQRQTLQLMMTLTQLRSGFRRLLDDYTDVSNAIFFGNQCNESDFDQITRTVFDAYDKGFNRSDPFLYGQKAFVWLKLLLLDLSNLMQIEFACQGIVRVNQTNIQPLIDCYDSAAVNLTKNLAADIVDRPFRQNYSEWESEKVFQVLYKNLDEAVESIHRDLITAYPWFQWNVYGVANRSRGVYSVSPYGYYNKGQYANLERVLGQKTFVITAFEKVIVHRNAFPTNVTDDEFLDVKTKLKSAKIWCNFDYGRDAKASFDKTIRHVESTENNNYLIFIGRKDSFWYNSERLFVKEICPNVVFAIGA